MHALTPPPIQTPIHPSTNFGILHLFVIPSISKALHQSIHPSIHFPRSAIDPLLHPTMCLSNHTPNQSMYPSTHHPPDHSFCHSSIHKLSSTFAPSIHPVSPPRCRSPPFSYEPTPIIYHSSPPSSYSLSHYPFKNSSTRPSFPLPLSTSLYLSLKMPVFILLLQTDRKKYITK